MMDCTVMSGFYFTAGKALFVVVSFICIMAVLLAGFVISELLSKKRTK